MLMGQLIHEGVECRGHQWVGGRGTGVSIAHCRNVRGLGRVSCNLTISTEVLMNEKFKNFQRKIVQMGASNIAKFHTNPYNFVASLPNSFKLSLLGNI